MEHFPIYVDVLLATYNSEKFIADQLDSILNQSYPYFHLIIQDDASQDQTAAIIHSKIEAFQNQRKLEKTANEGPKITFLQSQKNQGVLANFRTLIDYQLNHSNNSYVMFADHDDFWLVEKISKTLKKMRWLEFQQGEGTPLLVHTDLKVADATLNIIHESFWGYAHLNPEKSKLFNRLLAQNSITGCTVMVNRSLLELASPLPEEAIMHDWWIGLVAAAFGKIDYLKEPTLLYRQHQTNEVGAKKMNSLKEFFRYLSSPQKYAERKEMLDQHQKKQAALFFETYEDFLSSQQKKILKTYCQIHEYSLLSRLYLMLKYQIVKHGFFRTIKELIITN